MKKNNTPLTAYLSSPINFQQTKPSVKATTIDDGDTPSPPLLISLSLSLIWLCFFWCPQAVISN